MLFSVVSLTMWIIILVVTILLAAVIIIFLASYRIFSRTFSSYSKALVMRMNKDPESKKILENEDAKTALIRFEKAKRFFFTKSIKGSAFFLEDSNFVVKPQKLEIENGKKSIYSYFFSADDYCERPVYLNKTGQGSLIENARSNKFVIAIHGYDGCGIDNYKIAYEFMSRGYNVLSPDLIGHGNDKSKFISMGLEDSKNIIKCIEYIKAINSEAEIFLYGVSMGASTALLTLLNDSAVNSIWGIMSDCSFASAYEQIKGQLKKHTKLPAFPIMGLINFYSKLIIKVNLKKISPLEAVKNNKSIPILFIHGTLDKFIEYKDCEMLFQNCNAKKQIALYENARHAESMVLNYDDYWKKVENFIQNC